MFKIKYTLPMVALAAILVACGGQEPKSLDQKKAALQAKKSQLIALNAEINKLQAEIIEMDPEAKMEARKAPVSVMEVKAEDFQHYVDVQGRVEADQAITVSPQTSGRITKIFVKEGQNVRKGQVLAQLDDAIMQASMAELETSLELATIMFDKQQRLWDQEIGTEVQYLQAKNQKEALERKLGTLQEQLALNKITSPINGTVDVITPKLGELVSPGMPAFNIVNISKLSLKADLSESYVAYIKKGDKVKVDFPNLNTTLDAKVSVVGLSINPISRTFKVEVALPYNKLVKPNMYGRLAINDRTFENALAVPSNLVQTSEVGPFVYVAEKESDKWFARRVSIETGLSYGGMVQVTEGLQDGSKLITAGYKDLSDGQEVSFSTELAGN
ncbi:efflux RND transporter periplasmic adaptor subunit [Pontibacter sp. G13]|uniref:efflux RND transporter periplasmic adaptor subunit n=1 Tax=Pontibacter sp. G13 TaxID=3074898 RepID=UPI002889B766|nr:efflux RND transporter periplasmic adaptor subunit [Pontibacter sp. G13]WNJ19180.1 efflux RND transporter periplasmic adaptor subunit [Pontibacter sp. G13]